jgi:prevent-host-death family protein
MEMVGIKELKNKLTHYLKLTRKGDRIIVTDRGAPVAVLHGIDGADTDASVEERLAAFAGKGMVKLPAKPIPLAPFRPIRIKGKPASAIIIEERR